MRGRCWRGFEGGALLLGRLGLQAPGGRQRLGVRSRKASLDDRAKIKRHRCGRGNALVVVPITRLSEHDPEQGGPIECEPHVGDRHADHLLAKHGDFELVYAVNYLGDPGKISKVRVRFSRPVMVGDVVTYLGKVTRVEGGVATFEISAKNQKGDDVLKGAVIEARV